MGMLLKNNRIIFKKLFLFLTIFYLFTTLIFSYDGSNQTYDDFSNYNTYSLNTQSHFSSYPQYSQSSSNNCNLPQQIGTGPYRIPRWYYNPTRQRCELFYWSGCCGNNNNFQSFQSCQTSCEGAISMPTSYLSPMLVQNVFSQTSGYHIPIDKSFNGHQVSTPSYTATHLSNVPVVTITMPPKRILNSNPCNQPYSPGYGDQQIPRWFYLPSANTCMKFFYYGKGGDQNNFESETVCRNKCIKNNGNRINVNININRGNSNTQSNKINNIIKTTTTTSVPIIVVTIGNNNQRNNNFNNNNNEKLQLQESPNPCANGPSISVESLTRCNSNSQCNSDQFCHFGGSSQTTVCCNKPIIIDICLQPLNIGVGTSNLQRWYYNKNTGQCQSCLYKGLQGNQNNFLTKSACENTCLINPCKSGLPYKVGGSNILCNVNNQNVCPSGYYCHIGATSQTSVCCQALGGDPCNQVMDCGVGSFSLPRWYWNVAQQKCIQFTYLGQKGNQNNFVSQQACENVCYELDNPCAGGKPQMTTNNRPLQCSVTSNTCASNYWCHFGATTTTTVCCPNRVIDTEICKLPMVVGTGKDSLQRWYYDQNTKQCVTFTYSGRYGNQNNFLSQQACQTMCQVYDNVCPTGEPLLDESKTPIPCTFGSDSCGLNHWCHLGTIPSDYQCCPGQPRNPSACQGMPPDVGILGPTGQPVTRYYYDLETMSCKTFQYLGRKGNANNFISEEDCKMTCNVFNNPCNVNISLPPTYCTSSSQCPSDQWCHIGPTVSTSVCCPAEGNPCFLPLSIGNGNVALTRYYYDSNQFSCQRFTYTGFGGNANNFLTQQECEQQCAPNPCSSGMPYVGSDGRAQSCTSSANANSCPANYWCHIGADATTTVCCPNKQNNVCSLPMSTGEGNAVLERYYFDSTSKTCQPFIYKGLKGNENNFLSLRACQLACQQLENPCIGQPATSLTGQVLFCSATNKEACPVNFWCHLGATPETTVCCPGATNACSVPLSPGTGDAGLARWYYSTDERACVAFKYNGKRGNQNNFLSQAECERTCPEELCLLTVDSGACNNSTTRYAFDRSLQRCTAFTYSGCGGNANNFETISDCLDTCGGVGFRK